MPRVDSLIAAHASLLRLHYFLFFSLFPLRILLQFSANCARKFKRYLILILEQSSEENIYAKCVSHKIVAAAAAHSAKVVTQTQVCVFLSNEINKRDILKHTHVSVLAPPVFNKGTIYDKPGHVFLFFVASRQQNKYILHAYTSIPRSKYCRCCDCEFKYSHLFYRYR